MHFVIICKDKPGAAELRQQSRQAHLDYIAAQPILFAGPMLDTTGAMMGSMLVLEAENRAAVNNFLADDPYVRAGLFQTVEVHGWKKVIG